MRFRREVKVGIVESLGVVFSPAHIINSFNRASASARFLSWLRCRWAFITMIPSFDILWSLRLSNRYL